MDESDSFRTIAAPVTMEIKDTGSRFIGHLARTRTPDEAGEFIEAIRKEHYNATHNCFAWFIDETQFRYSDDGEPSGTAGKPIHAVLEGSGMTELTCVVTRYFGGTKLGTGGLIRAYSAAAKACLEAAKPLEVIRTGRLKLAHAYDDTSTVMHLIDESGGRVVDSGYGDEVLLDVEMPRSQLHGFRDKLFDLTHGRVKFPGGPDDQG